MIDPALFIQLHISKLQTATDHIQFNAVKTYTHIKMNYQDNVQVFYLEWMHNDSIRWFLTTGEQATA